MHFPVPFLAARPVLDGELPGGTSFCFVLPAPSLAQAVLAEGKQAGRINQIATVSQMIHFCTCFPETH